MDALIKCFEEQNYGQTLDISWIEKIAGNEAILKINNLPAPRHQVTGASAKIDGSQNQAAMDVMAQVLANLYISGVQFDFEKIYSQKPNKTVLPVYPFEYGEYIADSFIDEQLVNLKSQQEEVNSPLQEKNTSAEKMTVINLEMVINQLTEDLDKV